MCLFFSKFYRFVTLYYYNNLSVSNEVSKTVLRNSENNSGELRKSKICTKLSVKLVQNLSKKLDGQRSKQKIDNK